MDSKYIHKAGGILLKNRKFVLERHGKSDTYIIPGGKLEKGESAQEALIRELSEEFRVQVIENDLEGIGSFESQAVHSPDKVVRIDAFLVRNWGDEIVLDNGIEEVVWINSRNINDFKVSPITHEILPILLQKRLID